LDKDELLAVMQEHTDLRVVHIGSLVLALEPGCHAILAALKEYEPRPIIFLDPNVRPAVIDDRQAYLERMQEAFSLASLIKLSDEDLAYLHPHQDVKKLARKLAAAYSAHIILTLGREAAYGSLPRVEKSVCRSSIYLSSIPSGQATLSAVHCSRICMSAIASARMGLCQHLVSWMST
jgi:fructokinase